MPRAKRGMFISRSCLAQITFGYLIHTGVEKREGKTPDASFWYGKNIKTGVLFPPEGHAHFSKTKTREQYTHRHPSTTPEPCHDRGSRYRTKSVWEVSGKCLGRRRMWPNTACLFDSWCHWGLKNQGRVKSTGLSASAACNGSDTVKPRHKIVNPYRGMALFG